MGMCFYICDQCIPGTCEQMYLTYKDSSPEIGRIDTCHPNVAFCMQSVKGNMNFFGWN